MKKTLLTVLIILPILLFAQEEKPIMADILLKEGFEQKADSYSNGIISFELENRFWEVSKDGKVVDMIPDYGQSTEPAQAFVDNAIKQHSRIAGVSALFYETEDIAKLKKSHLQSELKDICRLLKLRVSGNKTTLIKRILQRLGQ